MNALPVSGVVHVILTVAVFNTTMDAGIAFWKSPSYVMKQSTIGVSVPNW